MKKSGKKYILKESELREIITAMVLMESLQAEEYGAHNLASIGAEGPSLELKDYLKGGLGLIKDLPNFILPNSWKEAIENSDNNFIQKLRDFLKIKNDRNSLWTGVELPVIRAGAHKELSAKQTTFISSIKDTLAEALRNNGVSMEFLPMLCGQAGVETGWNCNNVLAKKANNFTGITAPKAKKMPGYRDSIARGLGLGGRDAIWEPPGVPGDPVRWYTVFTSPSDWANYYVGDLLKRQYGAFDNGIEGFPKRLFIEGRPDSWNSSRRLFYGGMTQAKRNRYAQNLLNMYPKIKDYLENGTGQGRQQGTQQK